jgi:hypothetical protein
MMFFVFFFLVISNMKIGFMLNMKIYLYSIKVISTIKFLSYSRQNENETWILPTNAAFKLHILQKK